MLLLKLRKAEEGVEWESLDNSSVLKAREQEAKREQNKGKSTQASARCLPDSLAIARGGRDAPPTARWPARPSSGA